MRINKAAIAVLLVFIMLVLSLIVYLGTAEFKEKSPVAPEIIAAANQQAAASMKTEIQDLADHLVRAFPEDPDLTLAAVMFYRASKNLHTVEKALGNGLIHNPKNFNLNKTAAKVAFNNGDYGKAILFNQKALAINPKNPVVHEDLAEAMLSSGQYQKAVECLDNKVARLGGSARSYWLLGQGYLSLMNYEKAKEYYERSFQKDPSRKRTYSSTMAKVYMKLKQPEKAKEYMKLHREMTAQERLRKLEEVKNKTGHVVRDTSDAEVIVFSRNLLELCVLGTKLYAREYKMQDAQQLFKNTCGIFEEAIEIAPDNADLHRELATLYIMTATKPDEAQKLAKKAVGLKSSAENYYVLGGAYLKISNRKKAVSAFERALELDPENVKYKQAYDFAKKGTR